MVQTYVILPSGPKLLGEVASMYWCVVSSPKLKEQRRDVNMRHWHQESGNYVN